MKKTGFLAFLLLGAGILEAQRQSLDTTSVVVVGGSLSAGFSDFVLIESSQTAAFPALLAERMDTIMPLPLFRDGGPVAVISFDPLPDLLPKFNQSSLRSLPFPLFTFNLSVPFIRVSESLHSRPALPLVREGEAHQTLINMILGYPALLFQRGPTWSQVEYAEQMAPTFIIVEIGSGDVMGAALTGDIHQITPETSFRNDYAELIRRLRGTHATVLAMTVPDPTDTAYFLNPESVAQLYDMSVEELFSRFGVSSDDLVTLGGVVEIGEHIHGLRSDGLTPRAVLPGTAVATIKDAVRSFNSVIQSTAQAQGLQVFDLEGFSREVRDSGVQAGPVRLHGGFLEGFYSNDGLFPGALGQAALANRLLEYINSAYGTSFPLVDLESVARRSTDTPSVPLKSGFEALIEMRR